MAAFELTVDGDMLLWLRSMAPVSAQNEPLYHGFFPTEDVLACLDVTIDSLKYRKKESCPLCQRPSHQLRWIRYSSPASAWSRGGGVMGALSLCDKCNIQVQFIQQTEG